MVDAGRVATARRVGGTWESITTFMPSAPLLRQSAWLHRHWQRAKRPIFQHAGREATRGLGRSTGAGVGYRPRTMRSIHDRGARSLPRSRSAWSEPWSAAYAQPRPRPASVTGGCSPCSNAPGSASARRPRPAVLHPPGRPRCPASTSVPAAPPRRPSGHRQAGPSACVRHTFAWELEQARVPITVISALLGHSSIAVTARYLNHLSNNQAIEALEAVELPGLGA